MFKRNIAVALLVASCSAGAIAEETVKSTANKEVPTKTATKVSSSSQLVKLPPVTTTTKSVAVKKESELKPLSIEVPSSPKDSISVEKPMLTSEKTLPKTVPITQEETLNKEVGLNDNLKIDNESIRAILSEFGEAINNNDSKKLNSVTRNQLIVINSNQEFVNNKSSVKDYFPSSAGKDLKRTKFKMESGATIEISNTSNWAKVYGRGSETYKLGTVEHILPMRWSAVVVKEGSGWKIHSFHSGIEFAENSVMKATEDFAWKFAIIAASIGLLVGVMLSVIVVQIRK